VADAKGDEGGREVAAGRRRAPRQEEHREPTPLEVATAVPREPGVLLDDERILPKVQDRVAAQLREAMIGKG
jgi:hypothetical protein